MGEYSGRLDWADATGRLCKIDGSFANIALVTSSVEDLSDIPQCMRDKVICLVPDCCIFWVNERAYDAVIRDLLLIAMI